MLALFTADRIPAPPDVLEQATLMPFQGFKPATSLIPGLGCCYLNCPIPTSCLIVLTGTALSFALALGGLDLVNGLVMPLHPDLRRRDFSIFGSSFPVQHVV
jgi:hypothetical protein